MSDSNSSAGSDKRKSPRHLCSEGFSSSKLTAGEQEFELEAINYSHDGIALFNSQSLPDIDEFTISFSYQADDNLIRIEQLPCSLVHLKDKDSGVMLGAAFRLELANSQQIDDLIRIEEHIASRQGA